MTVLKRFASVRALAAVVFVSVTAGTMVAAGNGSRIAFEGDRYSPWGWGLSAMNPDGSEPRDLLAPFGAADVAWSPNGQLVAFEADAFGDGNLEIFVMNADG